MHSIRLTLVVYFLVLVTGALGVVSWLVYDTVAEVLYKSDKVAATLIREQCDHNVANLWTELDRRLARQVRTLASMARMTHVHYEGLYPLGVLGAAPMPQGHLLVPLWVGEGFHTGLSGYLIRTRPMDIALNSAEELLVQEPGAQEFFRVYRRNGYPVASSQQLDDDTFTLDDEEVKALQRFSESYDLIQLRDGKTLRRVTFRVNVHRYRSREFYFPWRFTMFDGRRFTPQRWISDRFFGTQEIFFQYAAETATLERQIAALKKHRDARLAGREQDARATLAILQDRLFVIGIACFLAMFIGGYLLVWLGLAPLRRLSDALAQVSEKDLTLKVNPERLPDELKPIGARLTDTLAELKKAFAHEKQLSADLSHELRTPLAALNTTLQVALRKARSEQEYRDMLEECHASTQSLLVLVERILEVAKLDGPDRLQRVPCDLSQLALQCAELVKPLAEKSGLKLRVQAPSSLPVHTDPQRILQVLSNLLHNAIEYNKPSGTIDLKVQRHNGHVLLEVQDTGIGIAPEQQQHLFERFFRADPSRHADSPHAGLGLAIVKRCIELLGGSIHVDSRPHEGTTFRVELPSLPMGLPHHPA